MHYFIFVLLCLIPCTCLAQWPASEWMEVNSIRARITPNGTLFTGGTLGGFRVPQSNAPDADKISLLHGVYPWVGGQDPAGNVFVSIGYGSPSASDFFSGLVDTGGYNRFWRVTGAEVQAHLADFSDNGVIDQPLPAVMEWPGHIEYEWSEWPVPLAPFQDMNDNGLYEPEKGEYPVAPKRFAHDLAIPDEMVFFAYHDVTPHTYSKGIPLKLQFTCTLFAYNCPETPEVHNALFAHYRFRSYNYDRLDSVYLGFLMDFQIGNPVDDFIGSADGIFYGYNGDTLDENRFGAHLPIVAMTAIMEPVDTFGIPAKHVFIPIYPDPAGAAHPVQAKEFYTYLKGRFRDGTPLRRGGTGYNPTSGSPPVCCAFPDDPSDSVGWSEYSAGNLPGNRRAVAAFGPVTIMPFPSFGGDMSLAFHWGRGDLSSPLSAYPALRAFWRGLRNDLFTYHPSAGLPDCLRLTTSQAPDKMEESPEIYPNPTPGIIRIKKAGQDLQQVSVFSITGHLVFTSHISGSNSEPDFWEISLPGLSPGIYLLKTTDATGSVRSKKLIVL